jgi:hypothetical protein
MYKVLVFMEVLFQQRGIPRKKSGKEQHEYISQAVKSEMKGTDNTLR